MAKEKYHHGNLPQALIRQGLRMLAENGEEKLSLREVAKHCGVSSAAPYSHFKNKDDFIRAIIDYVMLELTNELRKTEKLYYGTKSIIIELGLTYVIFFLKILITFLYYSAKATMQKPFFWIIKILKILHFRYSNKQQNQFSKTSLSLKNKNIISYWLCGQWFMV